MSITATLHSHEAAPSGRGVFPIDDPEQMNTRVQLADLLTPVEQRAMVESNLGLLQPDSPMRYLLEHRARPDLPPEDGPSYDAGVHAASMLLRRHLRSLAAQGVHFDEPRCKQGTDIVFHDPELHRPTRIIFFPLRRQLQHLQEVYTAYGRVGAFFAGEEQIGVGGVWRGIITGNIRVAGLPFLSDRQMETGSGRGFWRGAADTLQLHHKLYEEMGVAGELSPARPVLTQDTLPILRSRKRDTWPEAGITTPQQFSKGPDFYRQEHTAAGYTATLQRDGQTLRGDIWWNRHVPAGATLRSVRAFPSRPVLMDAGNRGEHTDKITSRLFVHSARLRRGDSLLVRGAQGAIFRLTHPFVVAEGIAGEDGTVELVRLCKHGEVLDLMDDGDLNKDALAQRDALSTEALAGQRIPLPRLVGRAALEAQRVSDTTMAFGGAATVESLIDCAIPHMAPGVPMAVSFPLIRAGLRLHRRHKERRASRTESA